MNIDEEETITKTCYKCDQVLYETLNIIHNPANSNTVMWNKFQIFLYEDMDFKSPHKTFLPEFQVHLITALDNYIVCLDRNGNIHTTSIKFEAPNQRQLKIDMQPQDQYIKTCTRYKKDILLSLKYEADIYFLNLHDISSDFQLVKTVILLSYNQHWPLEDNLKEKYILATYTTNENQIEHLKKIFETEVDVSNSYDLLVLSFDKIVVYGALFSPEMVEDEIKLVKLYQCPAEICNIEIIDSGSFYLLIGLTMGTVIRLSLSDTSMTPDVVHLNMALYKMIAFKDSLIYSDGASMWKVEDTFSNNIKFTQFFITNTKDFAKHGKQVVCITFSNLIYKFLINDKTAYLIPKTSDEYCSAEKLMDNSEYLNKLFKEIDYNNELVKTLNREQDYVTVLSLSNRQDIVGHAIESCVTVFESYDEASGTEFTLTEELHEYFHPNTWLFLVRITNSNVYNTLNGILSHLLDSIRFYITLSTPQQVLKTVCIKMEEPLKTVSLLIPLNLKSIIEIHVNIKIVVDVPVVLDKKKWMSVLYRNDIVLTSEHFIKTINKSAIKSLKTLKDTTENLIAKTASIQHGGIFQFTNELLNKTEYEWTFYVNLPSEYEQKFKSDEYCKKHLSISKTKSLVEQWSAEEFLKSKNDIVLSIGDQRLKVKVQDDAFSNPRLEVSGTNVKMAFDIRNFFAKLIYNDYENKEPGKEFISHTLYAAAENLQRAVRDSITSSATLEEFLPIINQFEKNIMGALPL